MLSDNLFLDLIVLLLMRIRLINPDLAVLSIKNTRV